MGKSAVAATSATARSAFSASGCSRASPSGNSTLALISTVMPFRPSLTRTLPSFTSGASTPMICLAISRICSRAWRLRSSSLAPFCVRGFGNRLGLLLLVPFGSLPGRLCEPKDRVLLPANFARIDEVSCDVTL